MNDFVPFTVNISRLNHRYAKWALLLAFGVAEVHFLTYYYNDVNSFNRTITCSSERFLNNTTISHQQSSLKTQILN